MGFFQKLFSKRFSRGPFDEIFALFPGQERMVGALILGLTKDKGGRQLQLHLEEEDRRLTLEDLPHSFQRYRIEAVQLEKTPICLCVREILPADQDFKKIESNSTSESFCTPIITEFNWYGIAIHAPREIFYQQSLDEDYADSEFIQNKVPKIIIAGTYNYECARIGMQACSQARDAEVHIRNSVRGKPWKRSLQGLNRGYVGHVLGMNVTYCSPPALQDDDSGTSKITAVGGCFNADIGMMLERPKSPVVHEVHVEYGPYRSNTVQITVHP